MATIAATDVSGAGAVSITETTLTASDTFTYDRARNPILTIRNDTAGAITVNIDGDGATSKVVGGIGSVDLSSGYNTPSIAIGAVYAVRLNTIFEYLSGTIAVTGGAGAEATLMEF